MMTDALSSAGLLLLLLASMMVGSIDSLSIDPSGKKHDASFTQQRDSISNTFPECSTPTSTTTSTTRRRYIQTFLSVLTFGPLGATTTSAARAASSDRDIAMKQGETITVPLSYISSLSGYVVYYSIGGEVFGAILDTGSPFLTVPSFCDRNKYYGCYLPEHSQPSGLASTFEQFDNHEGKVEWRNAPFSFVNATTSSSTGSSSMVNAGAAAVSSATPSTAALSDNDSSSNIMTFGVLSNSLLAGSGGTFLGLVRDVDSWIRPSFLGQTNVQAFEIDLLASSKTLTLTTTERLALANSHRDYIPLVGDLNRKYGDPTGHYTAKAKSFVANNCTVGRDGKPIYVIFDTGVSGMVVSQELLEERYATARKNRERSLWGTVQLSFQTSKRGSHTIDLTATKPLTTPLGEAHPWSGFNAHLIVVGLAFLDDTKMTVDIGKQKLWIER